jgi:hypothetical protein
MAKLQWFAGTWKCTNNGTIAGKRQKTTTSTLHFTRSGPWLDITFSSDKYALTRLTYNTNRARYVSVGTDSSGGYGISYFNVTPGGVSVQWPSVAADTPDDTDAAQTLARRGPNQYLFVNSGVSASGKNKGKRFEYRSVCTRTSE